MKKAVLTAIIMLSGVSAMAQYYPGPPPGPRGPVYYPPHGGGGGYHGRDSNDDAVSAMSAVTAAMFASMATACSTGPGCAYKKMIAESQDDAGNFMVTGEKTARLVNTFEQVRVVTKDNLSSEAQLAEGILQFNALSAEGQ